MKSAYYKLSYTLTVKPLANLDKSTENVTHPYPNLTQVVFDIDVVLTIDYYYASY